MSSKPSNSRINLRAAHKIESGPILSRPFVSIAPTVSIIPAANRAMGRAISELPGEPHAVGAGRTHALDALLPLAAEIAAASLQRAEQKRAVCDPRPWRSGGGAHLAQRPRWAVLRRISMGAIAVKLEGGPTPRRRAAAPPRQMEDGQRRHVPPKLTQRDGAQKARMPLLPELRVLLFIFNNSMSHHNYENINSKYCGQASQHLKLSHTRTVSCATVSIALTTKILMLTFRKGSMSLYPLMTVSVVLHPLTMMMNSSIHL